MITFPWITAFISPDSPGSSESRFHQGIRIRFVIISLSLSVPGFNWSKYRFRILFEIGDTFPNFPLNDSIPICAMVLEYESQHWPQKSPSFVGKFIPAPWSLWDIPTSTDFLRFFVSKAKDGGLSQNFIEFYTGWWWLEHFYFPIQLGMSSSQLTNSNLFQRGGSTTNKNSIYA